MKTIAQNIDHATYCQMLDEAESVVDLPDGGQMAFLKDGQIVHFSVITGEGCVIS